VVVVVVIVIIRSSWSFKVVLVVVGRGVVKVVVCLLLFFNKTKALEKCRRPSPYSLLTFTLLAMRFSARFTINRPLLARRRGTTRSGSMALKMA